MLPKVKASKAARLTVKSTC